MRRLLVLLIVALLTPAGLAQAPDRVTILYDAFGGPPPLQQDWGFAALVEHGGERILFDTGNDARIFEQNVRALRIDLKKLDAVVISHRHGDHIAGLSYVIKLNPNVPIYAPREAFGIFGGDSPPKLYKSVAELPQTARYFNGVADRTWKTGAAWPAGNFKLVDEPVEVAPGVTVISTVSQMPGTLELRELSLKIETPQGLILVVGCSHPGIEKILTAAGAPAKHLHALFGGLHLVKTPDDEIQRLAGRLREQWALDTIAPGHCTSEPAFAALKQQFGDRYLDAGLGSVVTVH